MAVTDFKFISPGVFINEIDNSQLPRTAGDIGPVVIGRSEKGPGLVPTTVSSFQEFTQIFGAPTPGNLNSDISRNGNSVGPTYGPYAAQAWLRNNSPITFVRLVGQAHTDAVAAGEAGWQTTNTAPAQGDTQGGAWGLFVFQSSSAVASPEATLAAVWYVNSGSVALSGTAVSSSAHGGNNYSLATNQTEKKVGTNVVFKATADKEFKVIISKGAGEDSLSNTYIETSFNFTDSDEKFIRRVFNTNPTLTNSEVTDSDVLEQYWLGETYEDQVALTLTTGSDHQYGVILPLGNSTHKGGDFRRDYEDSATGYFISQDLRQGADVTGSFDARNQTKLFRLVAKNTGRWASRSIKASITDIRAGSDIFNQYGTFSVQIRALNDTDNRPKILEQFNNCNLNPSSENYIGRKIGDRYITWSDEDRRYREYGDYAGSSKYVYVEAADVVKEGKANPEFLPFGVFGPTRFIHASASTPNTSLNTGDKATLLLGQDNYYAGFGAAAFDGSDTSLITGTLDIRLNFPSARLRVSASEGNPTDPRDVYFGVDTTFNRKGRPSRTMGDYTGIKPGSINSEVAVDEDNINTESMYVFTLDDMCNTAANSVGTNVYLSGSRQLTPAQRGALTYIRGAGSYQAILDNGCDKFTTLFHGGYDGLDVTEPEPFRNTFLEQVTEQTELNNYAVNSLKVAIDSLRDPEVVQFDLACMPGVTNNTLNRSLVDMCDDRGDALAIIDLKGGYIPETENTLAISSRMGSVDSTILNKKSSLQMNSSFGAAYYPWVQIQDTINGAILWAPPSIAALGAISYGQRTQELWFAPAGFTRGGLSANAAAGIPVVGVRERLTSKDRDKLYEANINPIAQFPAEGIVIFGQKTLQVTPSALDRINVRRLLIFLKRRISRIAATLLFDQNVQTTWNRFRGQVEPLLASVQAGLGLSDYKLILDETTTTPDLIDRNIMYAQIFLKPARAIEFIAIDFVITDSGASFDD